MDMNMNIFGRKELTKSDFIDPFDIEKEPFKLTEKESNQNNIGIRYSPNSNNKSVKLIISIGLNICNKIGFNEKEQVSLFLRKDGKSILILKENSNHLYTLHHANKGSSLNICFTYPFSVNLKDFRLNRTISTDYFIVKNNKIIVNLLPLLVDKEFLSLFDDYK